MVLFALAASLGACKTSNNESSKEADTSSQQSISRLFFKERIDAFENSKSICDCREQDEPVAYADAVQKYGQHRKSKQPETVLENFSRRLVALKTDAGSKLNELKRLQSHYNLQFTSDIPDGIDAINQYIDVQTRLRNIVIKDRQQNLESARKQSEDIFKSDFLLKMQDMIRKAKQQFKELNDCLGKLAYGGDTYRFTITSNREKESMYKMIMDENNMGNHDYTDDMANDTDHLSEAGAAKLTHRLDSLIKTLDINFTE